ncbi:uncharacterized protein si:ch211-286o17.1 isoform X1 [Electrophorus electricus]|uniref:uncharacterized protein si:ch211-286o17.1 isoform X1 n=1 Tax=Electrophorus electricus TaxID=8005 RepID=UPI0015D0CE67|nr:uncharacterized protein si:ch211-286o17.1 isoform X1 [Electrophorus electricus]
MEVLIWKTRNCCTIMALAAVICAISFRGVTCQDDAAPPVPQIMTAASAYMVGAAYVRGDNVPSTPRPKIQGTLKSQEQVNVFPSLSGPIHVKSTGVPQSPQTSTVHTAAEDADKQNTQTSLPISINKPAAEASHLVRIKHTEGAVNIKGLTLLLDGVRCVDESAVRGKQALRLKLKTSSSCEENRVKIQSVQEHLCHELEIYQQANTDEMIISGPCIQADAKGMRDKFNNDNIKDKVDIEEAELIFVKYSRAVLVSVLLTGLLLAALLIAGYLLTTHRRQAKGMRVAEDLFQVDEQNQGNTLLSVTPLPSQEPLDKPTSNGESPESPPTNGYSTTQTPVADTQM